MENFVEIRRRLSEILGAVTPAEPIKYLFRLALLGNYADFKACLKKFLQYKDQTLRVPDIGEFTLMELAAMWTDARGNHQNRKLIQLFELGCVHAAASFRPPVMIAIGNNNYDNLTTIIGEEELVGIIYTTPNSMMVS